MTRILFICMGNICRSPSAEGVFRKLLEEHADDLKIEVDSAGTHAYHVGEPPDHRSQTAAARRGVDLSSIRARKVTEDDFRSFDLLLAMDQHNYKVLAEICPDGHEHKLRLFLEFLENPQSMDVPDPYYGGSAGFEHVLDLVESASKGLIDSLRQSARA